MFIIYFFFSSSSFSLSPLRKDFRDLPISSIVLGNLLAPNSKTTMNKIINNCQIPKDILLTVKDYSDLIITPLTYIILYSYHKIKNTRTGSIVRLFTFLLHRSYVTASG